MSRQLDLDDAASISELAMHQLAFMRDRLAALEAALLEAMRISRGMESTEGVDDARIKNWRRTSHDLLQPNKSQAETPEAMHARIVTETADALAQEHFKGDTVLSRATAETKGVTDGT
jgi:hypothetical protein